ncbi:MAG: leucyl aminopeptidase family protein, partial [Anaerolineaceae bacterium]|nr:leucyl aminopeptidase family protein [Anaerolineaceae bacterium]
MKSFNFVPNDIIQIIETFPDDSISIIFSDKNKPPLSLQKFGEISYSISEKYEQNISIYADNFQEINHTRARKLGGLLSSYIVLHKIFGVSIKFWQLADLDETSFVAFFEGLFLGGFEFDEYKERKSAFVYKIYLDLPFKSRLELIENAYKTCFVVNQMRYLGQQPANVINPTTLSDVCKNIAEIYNLKFSEIDQAELLKIGAHGILAVGNGSTSKPKMIILEYKGNKTQNAKILGLVGKAITFDTGGYSIKSVDGIKDMKYDKLGGLTVLGTIMAASLLKLPIHIIGVICAAENMISDLAFRPDDIITTLSGKTVEIITTDAEGRLVLADGITLISNLFNPPMIIDFATLTGGIVTALGNVRAGLFSNDKKLTQQLFTAGENTNEKLWEMPLDDEYFEFIKGDYADLKNSGGKEG